LDSIVTLPEASRIVVQSLKKRERIVMCDVFGNCEKLSIPARGYVRGKFTKDGAVVWEEHAHKPLPQAFL
jgi:hypothetical protein